MNGLSVSGQKVDHISQIEIKFKPEVKKSYKLQLLSLSVRHD